VSRIYWDSMLFIYWLEGHPDYAPHVERIFQSMLKRCDRLCASYFCMGEVLTGPLKHKHEALTSKVRQLFDSGGIEILPFERRAAERYARLRAEANVKPADAIHLACAASSGVDMFLTHDRALHKLHIEGIQFIAGLDVNVF
jgi:predicted nucleic acid-binding protein